MMRLETERLILRAPGEEDIDAIFEAMSDWELVRMLGRPVWPYARRNAVEWLESLPADPHETGQYVWAITPKPAGPCCGMVGLHLRDSGDMELGFWVARLLWGKGLATEAAAAVLDYGFGPLGFTRVRSGYFTDNPGSARVHEKLGFVREGESLFFCTPRQEEVPHADMAMTAERWAELRRPATGSA